MFYKLSESCPSIYSMDWSSIPFSSIWEAGCVTTNITNYDKCHTAQLADTAIPHQAVAIFETPKRKGVSGVSIPTAQLTGDNCIRRLHTPVFSQFQMPCYCHAKLNWIKMASFAVLHSICTACSRIKFDVWNQVVPIIIFGQLYNLLVYWVGVNEEPMNETQSSISKLWYPVEEYSCWFGTPFKTGPQILDPIQEMVYFSRQLTIREMKVLVGSQSDFLTPMGPWTLLKRGGLKVQGINTVLRHKLYTLLRQGSLKTIHYQWHIPIQEK